MSKNMYIAAGDGSGNEALALRIQCGDAAAAAILLSRNEGYLTKLTREHTPWCEQEDLKQEGALALLKAASHFDPAYGTKLLTYATPAIEAAMSDYAAQNSLSLAVPPSRYRQLRTVSHLCAIAENASDEDILSDISTALEVSLAVAVALLIEYRTLFVSQASDDEVTSVSGGVDPARAYDRYMRWALLRQLMEEVLTPRELNLVRSYLGFNRSDGEDMTFQELAIRLNYNGPSGAEKAYKTALWKLKKGLYSSAYGQWLSVQRAIRTAKADVEQDAGQYATPQRTWWKEQALRY